MQYKYPRQAKFIMIIRGIILFFYIIFVFIIMGIELLWCRIFNKKKYYRIKRELDKF